jgi:hypothetical protein
MDITINQLEKILKEKVVYEVLREIHQTSQRWNKGGALIHRVRRLAI